MNKTKFYITTPIYYATAKPHIGSLYSTVLADVIARWKQLSNNEVFFLTGTDEHGNKIAIEAVKAGLDPQSFVDRYVPEYVRVWKSYHIEYTKFLRTTDLDHCNIVQDLITRLIEQGDIYQGVYRGWYCIPCENFVTEKLESFNQSPLCSNCNRQTHYLSEETYFFALSRYQDRLLNFYRENPHWIIPHERSHEIISFVEQGLQDLSITRTKVSWGVPFPGVSNHTLYVWIEALCNYITALGFDIKTGQFQQLYWPPDIQIMGKDIIRFHGVYWPILLMALGLPLPRHLLVHGWIKVAGQKMSKSLGNTIDPDILLQKYDADVIRYALIRYIPINQDSEFSEELVNRIISSDLADDFGNLLQRMVLLAQKYNYNTIDSVKELSLETIMLQKQCTEMIDECENLWRTYQLHLVYARLWIFIKQVNAYFHAMEPWKLIKNNQEEQFKETISITAHALLIISWYTLPVMPEKVKKILFALGFTIQKLSEKISLLRQCIWHERITLHPIEIIFPKIVSLLEDTVTIKETKDQEHTYASLDDLKKCQIVVGTIISCNPLEKSEKLFILSVDCGIYGKRTILTNIRQFYTADTLIGIQTLFMLNLKPRLMMGIASEGMILCVTNNDGKPVLVQPGSSVLSGCLIG